MGGSPLTNQIGKKVLAKLGAVSIPGKEAHPLFAIYHENRIVATTGLRHSSKKDIPVPHIKRDLLVSASFLLEMASCKKSREDWLIEAGIVPAPEEENG